MVGIEFEVKDSLFAIECAYPSDDDIERLTKVWFTSNEASWDLLVLEEDITSIIPSCWDGESEFLEASDSNMQAREEINQLIEYVLQKQKLVHFIIQTMCLMTEQAAIFNSFFNVMNSVRQKAVSLSAAVKEHDYAMLRTYLGWLPLDV
eukprot:6731073-Ditylum_brightwellii.AAC.1